MILLIRDGTAYTAVPVGTGTKNVNVTIILHQNRLQHDKFYHGSLHHNRLYHDKLYHERWHYNRLYPNHEKFYHASLHNNRQNKYRHIQLDHKLDHDRPHHYRQ